MKRILSSGDLSSILFIRMIVLLSGKRKSGKDYVAEKLNDRVEHVNPFNRALRIIRLSAPLKKAYASEHPEVEYEKLLVN